MFGPLIVSYLFLGGAAAGACLTTALLALLSPACLVAAEVPRRRGGTRLTLRPPGPYRRLLAPGFTVGLVALGLGTACLLADVGRADFATLLLASPPTSYVAVGTWAIIGCAALAAVCAAAWGGAVRLPLAAARVAAAALVAASLVVMAYTGLLLQSMPSVPVWTPLWLPVLFMVSAASCGIALVLAAGQLSGAAGAFATAFKGLAATDAAVIALEALVAALYVAAILGAPVPGTPAFPDASATAQALAASAQTLVAGPDAWLFWGMFAAAGLAVSFAFDLVLARRGAAPKPLLALASAACVLAGGFALRFCIVEAGLHPVLQAVAL